ncbi:unnamed protein product [Calypogeia fissa]
MAVSICCKSQNSHVMGSTSTNVNRISPPSVESAAPSLPSTAPPRENVSSNCQPSIALPTKLKSVDTVESSGFARWGTLAAAAAASLYLAASPAVMAGEMEVSTGGLITRSSTGDLSLSIAIPIPDPDTWAYSEYGFLAPPPGAGGEVAVNSNYQGGCPAWQPSQFEMIVPDGVHPKHNPRHGSVWPALYMLEEATIQYPAFESTDPSVQYASLIDALIRLEAGLTCFSL